MIANIDLTYSFNFLFLIFFTTFTLFLVFCDRANNIREEIDSRVSNLRFHNYDFIMLIENDKYNSRNNIKVNLVNSIS